MEAIGGTSERLSGKVKRDKVSKKGECLVKQLIDEVWIFANASLSDGSSPVPAGDK